MSDEHWRSLPKSVQRRVLEKVMLELRLHTSGSMPRELKLQMLRRRIEELEAEARESAGEDGCKRTR